MLKIENRVPCVFFSGRFTSDKLHMVNNQLHGTGEEDRTEIYVESRGGLMIAEAGADPDRDWEEHDGIFPFFIVNSALRRSGRTSPDPREGCGEVRCRPMME